MLRELYSDLITSRVIVNGRYRSTGGGNQGFPCADWTSTATTTAVVVASFLVIESRVSRDETMVERSGRNTHFVRIEETINVNANSIISRGSAGFLLSEVRFAFRISED